MVKAPEKRAIGVGKLQEGRSGFIDDLLLLGTVKWKTLHGWTRMKPIIDEEVPQYRSTE